MLWIQIRMNLTLLDPDSYWERGSGSGSRTKELDQTFQKNLIQAFQKGFCTYVGMFYDLLPTCGTHIFHVKIQLLVMAKSDQDWFGSPWIRIRIEAESWIRIRIDPQHDCIVYLTVLN